MTYDTLNLTNATDIYQMTAGVNELTTGYFAIFFLIALWYVLFVSFKNYDTKSAVLVINFIVLLVSVLMFFAGFIAWYIIGAISFFFVVSIFIKLYGGS